MKIKTNFKLEDFHIDFSKKYFPNFSDRVITIKQSHSNIIDIQSKSYSSNVTTKSQRNKSSNSKTKISSS
jgi:hypothetical protein